MDYQDELLLDALKRADQALYEAWKKSECGANVMNEINRIQKRLHALLRYVRATRG